MPNTTPTLPELVTTEQLSAILKVHPVTVRGWARRQVIRSYWTGSAWRFLVEEVLADLAVRRSVASA